MSGPVDSSAGGGFNCPVCRASLPADATFCLMCGTRQATKPAGPVRVNLGREATMLGLVPQDGRALRDTVLDPPPTNGEAAAQGEPKKVPSQHRTMMGFSSSEPAPPTPQAPKAQTLTGVAMPTGASPSNRPDPKVGSGRTMHGMAQVAPPERTPAPPARAPQEAPRPRREEPPLLGALGPGAASVRPPPLPAARQYSAPEEIVVSGLTRPRRRGGSLVIAASLLAVLAIGGITAALLLRVRDDKPAIAATVVGSTGERIRLRVTLPDAAGARLRVAGQTVPIDAAGRAEVELAPDRVGEVRVPAEVLRDGATEARELRYFIAWRVEPQLNELGADPPRLLLVFHVPPDASLSVSRHPIRVANGVGIASVEVREPLGAGDPEGARRFTFPVRVERAGAVTEGEYALRVRRTALRIDDPGVLAASAATLLTVRGTAPRATRVNVGHVAARVQGDTFTADVPLSAGPNTFDVVAFAPGGVPASQRITIYQGTTPEAYLAAAPGEHGAAALVQPRDGARVRVRGRVLRAIEQGPDGRTLQLVVADRACPAGQCTVWVDPPRGATAREGQDVEVTGEIQGARAYIAAGGARRSDPVLRALFVQ